MKIFLISDNVDTCTGMRLTGVEGIVAHTRDEVKKALDTALSDDSIGILLITEKLSGEYPELIGNIKLTRKKPLLVEVPDRHGTGRRPDFITAYVNDAIGLKL